MRDSTSTRTSTGQDDKEVLAELEKLDKKERTANLDNLRRVVKVCVENRIQNIKYGDVELAFMPEKIEIPNDTVVRRVEVDPIEKEFNPDYLIEHPPMI